MSKKWSKEDRHNFDKSEVMNELEDIVLKTIKRADILLSKINKTADLSAIQQQAIQTNESLTEVKKTMEELSAAEDDALDEQEDKSEILEDLDILRQSAIKDNNYKLAYRIERTIDEILEESVACE